MVHMRLPEQAALTSTGQILAKTR